MYVAPNISAASRCLSGHIGAVKEKTAGAVITTERPAAEEGDAERMGMGGVW